MNDLVKGFGYLREGLQLMRTPGLRRYVAMPLLISTVLFSTAIYAGYYWLGVLMDWMLGYLPTWLDWLRYLLMPLFVLTAVLLVFYSFTILTNLIAAPFNGLLAEAVEKHLTGQPLPPGSSLITVLKETPGAILDELRKIAYFLLRAIPLLILFWIPLLNLAAPVLWALFSAWMLAVEYCDYPMGNHGIRFSDQRARLGRRKLLSFGFGGTTLIATMIPVLNFLIMPAAVAGATALWVDQLKGMEKTG
jgi:CysZ protein